MHRRAFLVTLVGGIGLALPAAAAFSDDVVAQLALQGYQNITVSTTWLGRVRIMAARDGGLREIVLNPRTGEILRDLWTSVDGTKKAVGIVDDGGKGDQASAKEDGKTGNESSDDSSGDDTSGSDDGSSSGSDDGSGDDNSGSGSDDGGSDDDGSSSGSGSSGGSDDDGGSDDNSGSDDGDSSGSGSGGTDDDEPDEAERDEDGPDVDERDDDKKQR